MLYDIKKYAIFKTEDKTIYTEITTPPQIRVYYRTCLAAQIEADASVENLKAICARFLKIDKDNYMNYIMSNPKTLEILTPARSTRYKHTKTFAYILVYNWDEFWEDVYV